MRRGPLAFEGVQRGGEAEVAWHAAHDRRGERVQGEYDLVVACDELRSPVAHGARL